MTTRFGKDAFSGVTTPDKNSALISVDLLTPKNCSSKIFKCLYPKKKGNFTSSDLYQELQ